MSLLEPGELLPSVFAVYRSTRQPHEEESALPNRQEEQLRVNDLMRHVRSRIQSTALSEVFPAVAQRRVCSFGGGNIGNRSDIDTGSAAPAAFPRPSRPRSSFDDWGMSFGDLLLPARATTGNSTPTVNADPPTTNSRSQLRQSQYEATAAQLFGGTLSEVCPPMEPGSSARPAARGSRLGDNLGDTLLPPSRQPSVRPRASMEDFGGSLGDILLPRACTHHTHRPQSANREAAAAASARNTQVSCCYNSGGSCGGSRGGGGSSGGGVIGVDGHGVNSGRGAGGIVDAGIRGVGHCDEDSAHSASGSVRSADHSRLVDGERGGQRAEEAFIHAGAVTRRSHVDEYPSYDQLMQMHLQDNPPTHAPAAHLHAVSAVATAALCELQPSDFPDDSAVECSICLERVEAAYAHKRFGVRAACKLPCGHMFHRRCIGEWLTHDLRCPLCRLDLTLTLR
mmetsp:Transcript_22790/g.37772  ORF Transcript_22790/g.37772 Transcript_22790/m.37772 type:complete len:453 (+) Transcript_22790:57-1415(+)